MPKLTTRHDPDGHGVLTIHAPHTQGPIGYITPHMRSGEGPPEVEYHGRASFHGKHIDEFKTDSREVAGVRGPTAKDVLDTLQRNADEFYGDTAGSHGPGA